ncbi:MAG TPA: DNA replication/repair protein RecF [Anaerolineae bacterium]|nr:DNA replication/repair protein RecF [Anaerolineae bacterium]
MQLRHLSLTNFRNFARLEIDLPSGITLLHGDNAQGKTNFLEAIYYLATTRSSHTHQDKQLINWDAGQYGEPIVVGRLVAHIESADGLHQLEMRLIRDQQGLTPTFRREALVDRRKVRLLDLLGNLRVVLFVPQDMNLITGAPAARRRYLDITLCQSDRRYCRTLSQYNKLLEQRNALLRNLAENNVRRATDLLDIYTEQVVALGSKILLRRAVFMRDLAREVERIHYESLTAGKETIQLSYLPRLFAKANGAEQEQKMIASAEWLTSHADDLPTIEKGVRTALDDALQLDFARGATSVGPHRDDWRFWINGRNLNHYGSRGQQRSAVLALKMGEIAWVSAETKDNPLLLLDDIMAELDPSRRKLLIKTLDFSDQSFITSADIAIFSTDFLNKINVLSVNNGRISK